MNLNKYATLYRDLREVINLERIIQFRYCSCLKPKKISETFYTFPLITRTNLFKSDFL